MTTDHGARVRFAPSPTGFLHVGGARTALINWLFARHVGGTFILRIEDTDRERSTAEMTSVILDGLSWLGLDWDEGPFFQAAGAARHAADARALLSRGAAYPCFCPPAVLEARRAAARAAGQAWRYEGTCRDLPPAASAARATDGELPCLRFRVPPGRTVFQDRVHGEVGVEHEEIEDFVLLRSDGTPTYQLSCVSDDLDMRITHVIRGDDHLSNTPKQLLLYAGFGRPAPQFAHLPLIYGPDRRKLSKRHGAVSVTEYRDQGMLPDAMVNFLALLGWSPGGDREVLDRRELIEAFSLDGLSRANAIFDPRKLEWLNGQHLSRRAAPELAPPLLALLAAQGLPVGDLEGERSAWFLALLDSLKSRARTLPDLAAAARPYLVDEFDIDTDAERRLIGEARLADDLAALGAALAGAAWEAAPLETALRTTAAARGVGAARLIHPTRLALLGRTVSPPLFDVMVMIGRERTLARLQRFAERARDATAG